MSPDLYRAAGGGQEQTCRYPDGRGRLEAPMNIAALRRVTATWPETLRLWNDYRIRVTQGRAPTVAECFRIATTTKWLALAAFLRGEPVSETLASAHKAGLGFSKMMFVVGLAAPHRVDEPMRDVFSPQSFFELTDAGDFLVGTRQVCAGPRKMIEEAFVALAHPGPGDARAVDEHAVLLGNAMVRVDLALAAGFAAVRKLVQANDLDMFPGFGAPTVEDLAEWPTAGVLYRRCRYFAVRQAQAMPGLTVGSVARLWGASGAGRPEIVANLSDDTTLPALDVPVVRALASAAADLERIAGGPGDIPSSEDLRHEVVQAVT